MLLQRVLYPSDDTCACSEMYYHRTGNEVAYDGFFNLFDLRRWKKYTVVRDIHLCLTLQGACRVRIYTEKGEETCRTYPGREEPAYACSLPLPENTDAAYCWFSVEMLSEGAKLCRAAYESSASPCHAVHLAADICTYRREAYVRNNIQLLCSQLVDPADSPLRGKLDVYVIDNGQTLAENEFASPCVHLFRNKNTGGTGGFTRGILEIHREKKATGATHVIMLDDDAVIEPEAFVRTYALLSYIREEYEKACIGGMMLDLENRHLLVEAGAFCDDGKIMQTGKGLDLRSREALERLEGTGEDAYAGWWFACYPLTVARPDNLPLPFFLHYDDIEYGLRNQNGCIFLNGICIWHQNGDFRQPEANLYYDVRNRLITNALHNPPDLKQKDLDFIRDSILYNAMRFRYSSADLVLSAVTDFCRGPAFLAGHDAEDINAAVRDKVSAFRPVEELDLTEAEKNRMQEYIRRCLEGKAYAPQVGNAGYRMTCNGWVLPAGRNRKNIPCNLYHADQRELYRAKTAVLVDPYLQKGYLGEKDYQKMAHCVLCYVKAVGLLKRNYAKVSAAWRKHAHDLQSEAFWHRYLIKFSKQMNKGGNQHENHDVTKSTVSGTGTAADALGAVLPERAAGSR